MSAAWRSVAKTVETINKAAAAAIVAAA